MFTLVVFFCLLGTDSCDLRPLAEGFPTEQMCRDLGRAYIMPAWAVMNPDQEMRRWTCTDSPQALLYGHKA